MPTKQQSYYEREYSRIPLLQEMGNFGHGVRIGIIDGLVDLQHPYLQHSAISQVPCQDTPPTQHGTAVASQIVGKTIGISPQSGLTSVPVFKEAASGQLKGCSELTLAKAIDQAMSDGCEIISISGASLSPNGNGTQELRQAIRTCVEKGIQVVAAVGNDAKRSESVPASIEGTFAVAAHDADGNPAPFNNFGTKLRAKAILAPGVDVPAAALDGGYSLITGTSFAAPIVSGVLALTLATLRRENPKTSPQDAAALLLETALPCQQSDGKDADRHMAGRLDIDSLITSLVDRYPSLSALLTHRNKRITPMSDHPEVPEIEPATAGDVVAETSAPQDQITPVEMTETTSSIADLSVPSLVLPKIADPASNTMVHATPDPVVQPQAAEVKPSLYDEKIFAIGEIGYDFGTEARLDYFTQVMGGKNNHPFDPVQMSRHLNDDTNIEQSNALIWTLKIDGIPVYAIEPENQFAVLQYARLVKFLHDQEKDGVERVSIAGQVTGETRLFNGQVIPKFSPVLRGMFNWRSKELAEAVVSATAKGEKAAPASSETTHAIQDFLNRVYYELRNRGNASPERALNYAATNAFQMKEVFDDAFAENMFLNKISTEESPVSRPDSDCWDVVLEFFNPKERLTSARKLYRYTIDVSDVMPVTVGELRSWHAY